MKREERQDILCECNEYDLDNYCVGSPGERTSSIFRIIFTSCVARLICCFLERRVSMTCCSLMSAQPKKNSKVRNQEMQQVFRKCVVVTTVEVDTTTFWPFLCKYCKSRIFRMHVIFVYFVCCAFRTKIKCMRKVQSMPENLQRSATVRKFHACERSESPGYENWVRTKYSGFTVKT